MDISLTDCMILPKTARSSAGIGWSRILEVQTHVGMLVVSSRTNRHEIRRYTWYPGDSFHTIDMHFRSSPATKYG